MKRFILTFLLLQIIFPLHAEVVIDVGTDFVCETDGICRADIPPGGFVRIGVSGDAYAQLTIRVAPDTGEPPPVTGEIGYNPDLYQVSEAAGSLTVTVDRVGGSGSCSVDYSLSNGTASSGTDYTTTSGTLSFTSGETTASKTFAVTIIDRPGTNQGDLTFNVALAANVCSDSVTPNAGVVTIKNQDGPLPAGWVDTLIDGGVRTINSSSVGYELATNRWTIAHDGGEIFSTTDHFRAPIYNIASLGDVTFTGCVLNSHNLSTANFAKAGLMIRETTGATSRYIYNNVLGIDGSKGGNLSRRITTSATTSKTNYPSHNVVMPWGLKIEVDGSLESWKSFYSASCATPVWVEFEAGTETFLGTGDSVDLAIACTMNDSGDSGAPVYSGSCQLDDVVVDTTTVVDHSTASVVNFVPTSYQVDEDAGTQTITVTRSGGLSGALTVQYDTADITCTAGTHYTALVAGTVSWIDTEGGNKTFTVAVTDIAGEQGIASCTFQIDGAVTVGTDTMPANQVIVTWIDTDGTPPAQPSAWSTQGASGCSDGLGSFDAFVPGMRGKGTCNRGGFVNNTTVITVTNTNVSGTGSFAAAVTASCPKVILFGVSGAAFLDGQIEANSCDNWSIIGSSSPNGFTLTGSKTGALFKTRNSSSWTIGHITLASGDNELNSAGGAEGNAGNRGSISLGITGGSESNGLAYNNNIIWGNDETITCWPSGNISNITWWQNVIGIATNGSGVHINKHNCKSQNIIRNLYIYAHGRHPLNDSHGLFYANNFVANPGYETVNLRPCNGGSDNPFQVSIIHNLKAAGRNSNNHAIVKNFGSGCTSLQVYETGNAEIDGQTQSIKNCNNHNCVSGISSGELRSTAISAVYPTGYIPEMIDDTSQAGILQFATQITDFVGAFPLSRLSYLSGYRDEAINMVDGTGDIGGWSPPGYPSFGEGQGVKIGTDGEGGLAAITPTPSSGYDPTAAGENPCGVAMPTGSAANDIRTSGLTRLHEWAIGCFMDDVMPVGYREDKLQDFPL